MACLSITCHNCSTPPLPIWPKCLPIILLRHTVRMCIISCCSCSAGNLLRASSWANFSLLLQLRVRHFRIATVIILITNTKAVNFIPSSPPVPPFRSLPSLRRKLIFIWRDSASNWLQRRQRPVSFCVWHFKWANRQREMSQKERARERDGERKRDSERDAFLF